MRHLLKAVFDHRGDAQRVLDTLLAAGYAPSSATLTDVCPRGPDGQPDGMPPPGCHSLELAVGSVEDAKRAAAIIGRFAAVDTEVVSGAGTWQDAKLDDDRATAPVAPVAPAYPPGTEPGILQYLVHDDSRYFGPQNADAPPAGTTFQETMRAAAPWPGADIGNRDIDRTAVGYGREMRGDDTYRDRSWQEAEPDLKIGWEMRHPGRLSAWETFRDAIRHGWHRGRADTDDWPVDRGTGQPPRPATAAAGDAAGPDPATDRRDRYWQDVDADLAEHQAHLHPGAASSAWHRMKAAVRHGWQRVRH